MDWKQILEHIKEVHNVDLNKTATKEMVLHASYEDGYSGAYKITADGHEFFEYYAISKKMLGGG